MFISSDDCMFRSCDSNRNYELWRDAVGDYFIVHLSPAPQIESDLTS
jgi:hypothetical protein